MEFRIGVNLGDVMVEGDQIYGDGINVAARLESLADPGGICISGTVHEQVRDNLALGYEDKGEQAVKNIARSVHVWRVLLNGTTPHRETRRIPRRYWLGGVLSLTGLAIIVGTIVLVQHVSLKPPRTHAAIPPQEKPALPLPSIPSIAVLPFTNLSGDPDQDYLSDGVADQLIGDLSRLPGLFVIARNSSFAYKGKPVKRYDRPFADIFEMQDEIVGKVVTTLGLVLALEEMNAPNEGKWRPTTNLEAFDDILRAAQYFWRFTKVDNARARGIATRLDPTHQDYYAFFVANPYVLMGRYEEAIPLLKRHLSVLPNNPWAYAVLVVAYTELGRDVDARAAAAELMRINPDFVWGETNKDAAVNKRYKNDLRKAGFR
jgi:adenylate cyclase